MNPLWFGATTSGINGASREQRILEMILFVTLQRLIGQKSDQERESDFFGSKTSIVAVKFLGMYEPKKKSATADMTSCPTIVQQAWKKSAEKPSGPGVLDADISKTTCFNSSALGVSLKYSRFNDGGRLCRISWFGSSSCSTSDVNKFWKKDAVDSMSSHQLGYVHQLDFMDARFETFLLDPTGKKL